MTFTKENTTIRSDTTARHVHKYENKSIIHQLVLGRFLDAMAEEIKTLDSRQLLDFGCGECFFWQEMQHRGVCVRNLTGIDMREDALVKAKTLFPECHFINQDILTWQTTERFDLVVASQVLEHLPFPEKFLEKLISLTKGHLLLSVPWEPLFRLSNLLRGRDLLRLGNHPEHINGWGVHKFARFVASQAEIVRFRRVFPFLIIVCKPKSV